MRAERSAAGADRPCSSPRGGKGAPGQAALRTAGGGWTGPPPRQEAAPSAPQRRGPRGRKDVASSRFLPGAATGRPGGGARRTRDHRDGSSGSVATPGKAVPGPGGRWNRAGMTLSHQALPAGPGQARNRGREGPGTPRVGEHGTESPCLTRFSQPTGVSSRLEQVRSAGAEQTRSPGPTGTGTGGGMRGGAWGCEGRGGA